MKMSKAGKRDKKRRDARYGHKVSGKSVFLIAGIIQKRADKANAKRNKK